MKKRKYRKCKTCSKIMDYLYTYCGKCRPYLTPYETFLVLHHDYTEDSIIEERERLKDIYKTLDKI